MADTTRPRSARSPSHASGQVGRFLTSNVGPGDVFTREDLTADQKLFGQTAAEFMRREVLPSAARLYARDWPFTRELLRKAGELTPVSWDEALDFIAEGLLRAKREFGAASIVHYRSGGSLGLLLHLADYFFSLFGPVTVKRRNAGSMATATAPISGRCVATSNAPPGPRAAISTISRSAIPA